MRAVGNDRPLYFLRKVAHLEISCAFLLRTGNYAQKVAQLPWICARELRILEMKFGKAGQIMENIAKSGGNTPKIRRKWGIQAAPRKSKCVAQRISATGCAGDSPARLRHLSSVQRMARRFCATGCAQMRNLRNFPPILRNFFPKNVIFMHFRGSILSTLRNRLRKVRNLKCAQPLARICATCATKPAGNFVQFVQKKLYFLCNFTIDFLGLRCYNTVTR